ncbi:flagellar hook-associated protein FlgL [Limnobacter sp.]|uniref:flagellar hook-associated protein FlgL n=1 Tax=Limnobacter sp. TaxID=2003368 RepID=UPI0035169394
MTIGRISTNQYFKLNTERMSKQQSDLVKVQGQLATGQRVLKPSDDPLAMSVALGAKAGVKTIESYQSNLTYINNQLSQMDVALQAASDVMVTVKQTMLQAGNASLGPSDREILAQDLEGLVQELRGIANRTDPSGDYLFSGTFQNQAPFQVPGGAVTGKFLETASAAAAQAVTGRDIQVSSGRFINLNITGNDAFVDPATNETAFEVLNSAIALLRNPGFPNAQEGATPSDTYLKAFNNRMAQMDDVFDQVQLSRTKVGVRMREAETLEQINQAAQLELERVAGEAAGLDYAKAISELSQGQLQLQAAQQSFAQVSQLSLFNFLR